MALMRVKEPDRCTKCGNPRENRAPLLAQFLRLSHRIIERRSQHFRKPGNRDNQKTHQPDDHKYQPQMCPQPSP
ncbi:hypothetical protein GCM10025865_33830 (plasmid) [Paraoerskovia sediminicola]|uniref:Transposase n=1 Tax=Paraoerskovia sediminicola TaxID=1138587 RepID=A0ABN6XGX7_9CELL|nr:hypothetical protein GCM10025865_33390 [Paraoerskovia sediminicola]BDZ44084.1 hypothetical protein GCM10025865_33830 [Paraoerskovia sediminicola]